MYPTKSASTSSGLTERRSRCGRSRHGAPLVLVHGSMQDHMANRSFVDALTDRGRCRSIVGLCGASADSDRCSIDREFDDVAAVVEAVAKRV